MVDVKGYSVDAKGVRGAHPVASLPWRVTYSADSTTCQINRNKQSNLRTCAGAEEQREGRARGGGDHQARGEGVHAVSVVFGCQTRAQDCAAAGAKPAVTYTTNNSYSEGAPNSRGV
eukprot:1826877-Pyramimonas_sp.AAC.1